MLPVLLLSSTVHAATVTLNGGGECLSVLDVELAVDDTDGLLQSDRILVDLVRLSDPWVLHVRVIRHEVQVWTRSLRVGEGDCALLPTALARALERGLEGVPRWPFADESRWLVGVRTSTSWPYSEWTGSVTFGRGPRPRGIWSWEVDAGTFVRGVQPVGRGRAILTGLSVGVGPIAEARLGSVRLGVRPRLAAGFGSASVRSLAEPDDVETVPRATADLEGHVRLPAGLHVGVQTSWIVMRTAFVETSLGQPATTAPEPRFRVGLFVGLRAPVGE